MLTQNCDQGRGGESQMFSSTQPVNRTLTGRKRQLKASSNNGGRSYITNPSIRPSVTTTNTDSSKMNVVTSSETDGDHLTNSSAADSTSDNVMASKQKKNRRSSPSGRSTSLQKSVGGGSVVKGETGKASVGTGFSSISQLKNQHQLGFPVDDRTLVSTNGLLPSSKAQENEPSLVSSCQHTSSEGISISLDTHGIPAIAKEIGQIAMKIETTDPSLFPSFEDSELHSQACGSSLLDDVDEEMTESERALANRLRNREHARNTRLRKKAYLEQLKTTLDELCRERDALVSERSGAASHLLEMQKTRTDVLLSFFVLRSKYERRRPIWSSIMDESVTCVMPVTPYRSFHASEVQVSKCQRTILGVDGMISDAASLHVLLNTLVDRSRYPDGNVEYRYTLIAEEAVVSTNQMMARWSMNTVNAKVLGARQEVGKTGMLSVKFNAAHKIVSIELMFDVMAFMLQLKQSVRSTVFAVVPNTVQTCQGPFGNAGMVMTLAERPYTIVQVNRNWEKMTGWNAEDVVGKASCQIMQGPKTNKRDVAALMDAVRLKRPAFAVLTNYMKGTGKAFRNYINFYPLSTDSRVTHYVALTDHVEWLDNKKKIVKKKKKLLKDNPKRDISINQIKTSPSNPKRSTSSISSCITDHVDLLDSTIETVRQQKKHLDDCTIPHQTIISTSKIAEAKKNENSISTSKVSLTTSTSTSLNSKLSELDGNKKSEIVIVKVESSASLPVVSVEKEEQITGIPSTDNQASKKCNV